MLRLSYRNDTLQHFLVALGSFDESFRLRMDPNVDPCQLSRLYTFSLQQYNQAIQSILQDPEILSMPVLILTCSVLCILYELWAGDMYTALQHLESAHRIQKGLTDEALEGVGAEQRELLQSYVRPIILRNAKQLRNHTRTTPSPPDTPESDITTEHALAFETKDKFTSIADAQADFQQLSDHIIRETKSLSRPVTCSTERLKVRLLHRKLDKWLLVFNKLRTPIEEDRRREHTILAIRNRVHRACLSPWVFDDEMIYDQHEEDFQAIVKICGNFLKRYGQKSMPDSRRNHDSGMVMALSLVGTRCRDPEIRREAIRLLYRYWLLEGVWASPCLAILCEVSMMLEEASLGSIRRGFNIPKDRRLRLTALMYDPGSLEQPSDDCTEVDCPPVMTFCFRRPHSTDPDHIFTHVLPHKVYHIKSGFGVRSVALWPDPAYFGNSLLDTEIDEEMKHRGGPHGGRKPWTTTESIDLESICNMTPYSVNLKP